jgi:sugar phosphate isomerase/epimerase
VSKFPFRIGTTSYIIPDEILPNVRYLADKVDDVELVLFEVDDGPNNLPDRQTLQELMWLAGQYNLTYTVHLPLDLRLAADDGSRHVSLQKAKKVIDCTKELLPFAYVLHLDGRELLTEDIPVNKMTWNQQAIESLKIASEWVGDAGLLAVENLENYPLSTWDEAVSVAKTRRCIDVGHLWLNGHDPVVYLAEHISETRVIHVHGVAERDHQSLRYVPRQELSRVFEFLDQSGYQGVVTLEVFNEDDFQTSMRCIESLFE